MKIPHRVPDIARDRTDPVWAERVEREAEQHTARTETAWHKAQRRLSRAIEKVERAEASRDASPSRIKRLWEVVQQRREELLALERLARQSCAGSQNRGKGSHRGVTRGEAW